MALPMDFARREPTRIAVIDDADATLSYGDLDARAWQLARLIRKLRACGVGEHVAFCLENRLEYFWVAFGAHYAGVYYTAISPWLRDDEITYIVNNCGARLVIGTDATVGKMAHARAGSPDVVGWLKLDGATEGWEDLAAAMAAEPADPLPDPREGRDMLYSSGLDGAA